MTQPLIFPMKRTLFSITTLVLASTPLLAEKKYDAVERGEKVFESLGCVVCHDTEAMDTSAKTGPILYGLFLKQPQEIEVMIAESQQKHNRIANKDYFSDTIRNSMDELAISRDGPLKGQAYQPIMPSFPKAVMSDTDLDSVFHYLRSRGPKGKAGPGKVQLRCCLLLFHQSKPLATFVATEQSLHRNDRVSPVVPLLASCTEPPPILKHNHRGSPRVQPALIHAVSPVALDETNFA